MTPATRPAGQSQIPSTLAIIVPVLNEMETLPELLEHLRHWQQRDVEVLLVDGGSEDGSREAITEDGFTLLQSPAGRALQMNTGARASNANQLLFLHADTRLPANADQQLLAALNHHQRSWGRFDVRISGRSVWLPVIAFMMNRRSRLSGIATGDQAIFMTRSAFEQVGGFPEQPLMEDIAISKRLKALSSPICLTHKVTTSGRRWDSRGSWRTILLMWQLRWAYWRGVPAEHLAKHYR